MAPSGETTENGNGRQDIMVLHSFRVAPALPPSSEVTPPPPVGALELTYLDMVALLLSPVERLLFYRLPGIDGSCSTREYFLHQHLAHLKHALSHALAVFWPLAGHIVRSNPDAIPFIRYEDGDAVDLTVVESHDDFEELAGDAPKESTRLFPLVPVLIVSQETKQPVLAAQVTLFPGRGVALGVTVDHFAADGSSSTHFLKTWAAFCRELHREQGDLQDNNAGEGLNTINGEAPALLPVFDRSLLQDPNGLRDIYFEDITRVIKEKIFDFAKPTVTLLRATFPLSRADLDLLRRRAAPPPGTRYSSFTVACALTWVCAVKAGGKLEDDKKLFSFAANLRQRLRPPLPTAYFGNCLGGGMAVVKNADLVGDEGLAVAAAAIWKAVQGLDDGGVSVWQGEDGFKLNLQGANLSDSMSVAGSPSLRVYEVDFGWGRPAKVEVVSCEKSGGISLAETADGHGGIEVGVPLPPEAMPEFQRLWRSALEADS